MVHDLFERYGALVIKPTQGSQGQDVVRCDNPEEVFEVIKGCAIPSWAASPFVDIKREVRVIMLNDKPEMAYEKYDPPLVGKLRLFNLHRGAKAKHLDVSALAPELITMSQQAMRAIGLTVGAVDIVFDQDGTPYVLEINSAFSIERFAGLSAENRREAVAFYERLIRSLFD